MHNTPITETSLRVQHREKNSGDPVPNQQLIPKKFPQSQKPLNTNLDRTSGTLDNIKFFALSRSEVDHWSLEDESLCVDPGEELSSTSSSGPARGCVGTIRS